LEQISEPDEIDPDDDEGEEGGGGDADWNDDEAFFDTQSTFSQGRGSHAGRSASDKGEDDPVGPIMPGSGSKFELAPEAATAKPRNLKSKGKGMRLRTRIIVMMDKEGLGRVMKILSTVGRIRRS
jgi:hypothetical protein